MNKKLMLILGLIAVILFSMTLLKTREAKDVLKRLKASLFKLFPVTAFITYEEEFEEVAVGKKIPSEGFYLDD